MARRNFSAPKYKKQKWLFSDSYGRSRRETAAKILVRTRRAFFVKCKNHQNLTKFTFYGPWPLLGVPLWAWAHFEAGPFGAGPFGAGPFGAGPFGAGPIGAGPFGARPCGAGPFAARPLNLGPDHLGPGYKWATRGPDTRAPHVGGPWAPPGAQGSILELGPSLRLGSIFGPGVQQTQLYKNGLGTLGPKLGCIFYVGKA